MCLTDNHLIQRGKPLDSTRGRLANSLSDSITSTHVAFEAHFSKAKKPSPSHSAPTQPLEPASAPDPRIGGRGLAHWLIRTTVSAALWWMNEQVPHEPFPQLSVCAFKLCLVFLQTLVPLIIASVTLPLRVPDRSPHHSAARHAV
mmetsp:Transcript_22864/g.69999  ORF Transcript_22864/g.69999 Transcript_22864/m.69999 type:complete len:145 (-) Transcript_22864:464-898(-)